MLCSSLFIIFFTFSSFFFLYYYKITFLWCLLLSAFVPWLCYVLLVFFFTNTICNYDCSCCHLNRLSDISFYFCNCFFLSLFFFTDKFSCLQKCNEKKKKEKGKKWIENLCWLQIYANCPILCLPLLLCCRHRHCLFFFNLFSCQFVFIFYFFFVL